MNPTTWLVQTNFALESPTPVLLQRACDLKRRPYLPLTVLPGSKKLPPMPEAAKGGPVVFHGRSTLILNALRSPWRHGVFFNPNTFQHRAYAEGYGHLLLNHGAEVMTWTELLEMAAGSSGYRFVKPNDDYKGFTGQAIAMSAVGALFESLRRRHGDALLHAEVVVAPAHEVDAEWRIFVVDGEVITGSMYRPAADPRLPSEVIEFSRSAIEAWTPAAVFAIDVGRVSGQLRVVECNCFNASRLYESDVNLLVEAISDYQEARYAALPAEDLAGMLCRS